jgi:hypothetical protein
MTTPNPTTPQIPAVPDGGGYPFSLRTVVLMLVAAVVGAAIGVLTFMAGQPVAAAVVAGMVASGTTFTAAHLLVEKD